MRVLKFGGTSVGTAEALQNVKQIVERTPQPAVVVVSALGGTTDRLLEAAARAAEGDAAYAEIIDALAARHRALVEEVVPTARRKGLSDRLASLLAELRSILHGVFLIKDLTPKTSDAIAAYGERLSSEIVAEFLEKSALFDARTFIKTRKQGGKHIVDFEASNRLVRTTFEGFEGCAVVGGFIAADADCGLTTNLGRGGSDYTAAIIAAALDAEALEIWTDVDGFMTADPDVIPTAYTIDRLTYNEAMELCNFGAKVIYPPSIFPVCAKNIPILVKNTFRPDGKGSVISAEAEPIDQERPIRGISSISQTSVVEVTGPTMVGVIGINRRIFTALTQEGISVFMAVQTSSETSMTLCVTSADAPKACAALDREFAKEIEDGAMNRTAILEDMATVAVVGEGMRRTSSVAGKLFSVLARNGIGVAGIGQGTSEINLSFIIRRSQLRKALNVLHNSFFLSEYLEVNLFVCGTGNVGGSLLRQIAAQRELLMRERRFKINLVGVGGTRKSAFCRDGIDPAHYKEAMAAGQEGGVRRMVEAITDMNIFNSVFVDCTASKEVAQIYPELLRHNVNIVAANKIAASADYEKYKLLKDLARERGVKYLFETNVGAGLPIINTINDLRSSGDEILKIEAVVSGTLNFLFSTLSKDCPLSKAVRMAKEQGYSEPDPRIDLSGKDVMRKLVILARESGYEVNMEDIEASLFIPDEFFSGSIEDFWQNLPSLDAEFEAKRAAWEQQDLRPRFVATWEDGRGRVGLQTVGKEHPFYNLQGSNNIFLLTTSRYREYPMLIQGYGAGADVTAAGVFADIMRVANL